MEVNKSYSVCIQQVVVNVLCIQEWPSVRTRMPASYKQTP